MHSDHSVPLVVDVDGTLIKTDLLLEASLHVAARDPLNLWRIPVWLMRGKSALKKALTDSTRLDVTRVPLRDEIVALIRAAQRNGRAVYLASASDCRLVQQLADRVGGIAGVFGTEDAVNLGGAAKARRLVREFGEQRFDYVGDAYVDFPVWRVARKVLAVSHHRRFETRLLRAFPGAEIVARPRPRPKDYVQALRPHQWAKNALIFLPMLAGHYFMPEAAIAAAIAFVCFSMVASSAYLINDLLDLPADREHPRKRERPFASGKLPLQHGVALAVLLILTAWAIALQLPRSFRIVLLIYLVGTLAYSMLLKRKIAIDVVVLGGLYAVRVLAGITAIGARYSPWLLMFCLFFFLALAIVKRCSELIARERDGKLVAPGRGYRFEDLRALLGFGAAAGYGAVFVVALYLSSPEVRGLYEHPNRLWLACPILLYWTTRIFMISNRGELHDDPLVFALTDSTSWLSGACMLAVLAIAI